MCHRHHGKAWMWSVLMSFIRCWHKQQQKAVEVKACKRKECVLPVLEGMNISDSRVHVPILPPPNPFFKQCLRCPFSSCCCWLRGAWRCVKMCTATGGVQQELQFPASLPLHLLYQQRRRWRCPGLPVSLQPHLQLAFCVFRSRAWPYTLALTFLSFSSSQGAQELVIKIGCKVSGDMGTMEAHGGGWVDILVYILSSE